MVEFQGSPAGVTEASGIVYFKGRIHSGSPGAAFTLPAAFRPTANVYVPVSLCSNAKGRLLIQPSGAVTVQAEGAYWPAQCGTSLEGASYALSASGFTALPLVNGWTNAPFGTSQARVSFIDGIVHFKGAIANGSATTAFTLPGAFRPSTTVYVPVDLCGAAKGRLIIQPNGVVQVDAEGPFSDAQCFTSLDGASYGI